MARKLAASLSYRVTTRRNVRHCALLLDQLADAVGVVGFVSQHDGTRAEVV
jgi:hypothetical protein